MDSAFPPQSFGGHGEEMIKRTEKGLTTIYKTKSDKIQSGGLKTSKAAENKTTKTMIFFDGQKHWTTSTSRSDEGDGACEIIYVTSVTILQHR